MDDGADARDARETRRWLLAPAIALAALTLLGTIATSALWLQSSAAHERAERSLAALAAQVVQARANQLLRSLDGAAALAVDGEIDREAFAVFARDIAENGTFQAMGMVQTVTEADRAAFEASTGGPILQRGDDRISRPAPSIPTYRVLRYSEPANGRGAELVGHHIAVDDIRREAFDRASELRTTVLTRPVIGLTTGELTWLMVVPLLPDQDDPAPPRWFLLASVQVAPLLTDVTESLPKGTEVAVADGTTWMRPDKALDEAPPGARATTGDIGGRTWTVAVVGAPVTSRIAPVTMAVATLLCIGALAWQTRQEAAAQRRERALQRALDADRARTAALAAMGRALAVAHDPDEVAVAAARGVAAVTGAQWAQFVAGERNGSGFRLVEANETEISSRQWPPAEDRPPWPSAPPAVDAFLHRCGLRIDGHAAIADRFPDLVGAPMVPGTGGFASMVTAPLVDPDGRPLGALALGWSDLGALDGPTLAMVSAGTDLCAQALERATAAADRARRAERLAQLSQALAAAQDLDDLALVVARDLPVLVDAEHAVLLVAADGDVRLMPLVHPEVTLPAAVQLPVDGLDLLAGTHPAVDTYLTDGPLFFPHPAAYTARYPQLLAARDVRGGLAAQPVHDASGRRRGVLLVGWERERADNPELRAELRLAADTVGQTLERAALYQVEHGLVVSLQRRILRPVRANGRLELAARYLPALQHVRMGGDWYDVVTSDDGAGGPGARTTLVVGDVVGHGIDAIAHMAEIRALISGLLHASVPLAEVIPSVRAMLDRTEPTFATVQLLEIDVAEGVLRHVSAGHPPAVLATPRGEITVLDGARAPLIGIAGDPVEPASVVLEEGTTIVAYTDGLIERRGESIDTGTARLVAALQAGPATRPLEVIVNGLLHLADAAESNHDDIVVVAARYGSS